MQLGGIDIQSIRNKVTNSGHNLITPGWQKNQQHENDNDSTGGAKMIAAALITSERCGNPAARHKNVSDGRQNVLERQALIQKIGKH